MTKNHFYEKKGPYPLKEIIKAIGSDNKTDNNNIIISGFESLDTATNSDITFLNSQKYKDFSLKTEAAACITTPNLSKFLPENCVIYGSRNDRRVQSDKPAPQNLQIEFLSKVLPNYVINK